MRQADGTWSNPVFIHLVGGSFGAQAGAQSTDLVLVFQTQKGLDRFLKGKGKLTLGVDVGVAAGPAGKRFEASTDAGLKSEILSYSNTRGIFAGVSAEGGTLQIDWRANTLYYGQPVSPAAILAVNSTLAVPASTIPLQQMLAEKTAWPERIARGKRVRSEPVIVNDETTIFDDQDAVEIDGAIRAEPARAAADRPRTPARREARPQAEPAETTSTSSRRQPAGRRRPSGPGRNRPTTRTCPRPSPDLLPPARSRSGSRSHRRPMTTSRSSRHPDPPVPGPSVVLIPGLRRQVSLLLVPGEGAAQPG